MCKLSAKDKLILEIEKCWSKVCDNDRTKNEETMSAEP